jgi:hypothetical protein
VAHGFTALLKELTMTTRKQVRANRRNARKGGPKTPEGMAVSCLNARKHGVFASALTDQDEEELAGIHDELFAWIKPVGPVEGILVEKLAHTYLRMQRCARAEAEYHISTWEPSAEAHRVGWYLQRRDEGQHASWFTPLRFEEAVSLLSRYDTALTNQLIKLLHEIERLQRLRAGDDVPAPLAADLTLHADGDVTLEADRGSALRTTRALPAALAADLALDADGGLPPGDVEAAGVEAVLRNEPNPS